MKAKKVLEKLEITSRTLSNYVKNGKIRVTVMDNGQYDYNENDVNDIERKNTVHENKVVIYRNGSRLEYALNDEKIDFMIKLANIL